MLYNGRNTNDNRLFESGLNVDIKAFESGLRIDITAAEHDWFTSVNDKDIKTKCCPWFTIVNASELVCC